VRRVHPDYLEHGCSRPTPSSEIVNDDIRSWVRHGDDGGHRHGLTLHLSIHPLVAVNRDADGVLQVWPADGSGTHEAFIHVESTACPEPFGSTRWRPT